MITTELRWKPINGFEGLYEVSEDGRVRSLDRLGNNRNLKGKEMKLWSKPKWYVRVTLTSGKFEKSYLVHRLVGIAFIPNPENKLYINHKDGDKQNNHISNLEWCTNSENMIHAFNTGLIGDNAFFDGYKGEESPVSKLTSIDIQMIKILGTHDFTNIQIAKRFNVSAQHVGLILKNKTWVHFDIINQELIYKAKNQ